MFPRTFQNTRNYLVETAVAKPPFRECYRGNILRYPAFLMGAGKLSNFGNNLVEDACGTILLKSRGREIASRAAFLMLLCKSQNPRENITENARARSPSVAARAAAFRHSPKVR